MSAHMTQIPEAVRLAAPASGAEPGVKEQAVEYLAKVKELCEETWQACLALYLQGAGAAGPGQAGKDGKEKLGTELRMFCEQVYEAALIQKPEKLSQDSLVGIYNALVEFITTEWVDGGREAGQTFLRNKLSFDLAHLFIDAYPAHIPSFLHPFFTLLQRDPSSSQPPNFDPVLLVIHLFSEIALEIHDSTVRSARPFSQSRHLRDGNIRDAIRSSGDEALAVQGLLTLVDRSLGELAGANRVKWAEVGELAVKTLAAWTPWVELSVTLNPQTLAFYQRLLSQQDITSYRTATANVIRTFIAKGQKTAEDKLQVLDVLSIVGLLDPLESSTRGGPEEVAPFRAALAGVLATYGVELIELWDNEDNTEALRKEAETRINNARPLLLRFLSDPHHEVHNATSPFVSDLLRVYKRMHMVRPPVVRAGKVLPPPTPTTPILELPQERREFLASLLDVSVRQLAWPEDAEWEAPTGEEPDVDDELAMLQAKRVMCRSYIESVSHIEKSLHTEVVARIVMTTLEAIKAGQAVPWQQAELAVHLVYTFGEVSKNNTRAAFFELPLELSNRTARERIARINLNKQHYTASGRTTPDMTDDQLAEPIPGVSYKDASKFDYEAFPLTPLGHLLTLCVDSGIASFPHPSVTLQFFEAAVRYSEFFRAKEKTIQPMFEALLDSRGIHHPDEVVRRRCFYLFSKFVKDTRSDLAEDMIPIILESMKDLLDIRVETPTADAPDEDPLLKATTGKSYFMDQLYLFESAGMLIYMTRADGNRQIPLLQAIAGPLVHGLSQGLVAYRANSSDLSAVLSVHHHLLALGNFAKGFPLVADGAVENTPYQGPFKQMTEALLEALEAMKTQRVVRDSARFAFSQFVNAIGTTVAELVPQFVQKVVTEFEPAELIDFMTFLGLLMHRLKRNTFETMDMLLLPLLSRIFSVLQQPITGTDDAGMHRKLKDAYLVFFIALMNANLDGVFISARNKPEFENLLSTLYALLSDNSDASAQRQAFAFFAKSVVAWATSGAHVGVFADSAMSEKSKMVVNGQSAPSNQHAIAREERAGMALEGYESFVYGRLVPACFEVPAAPGFNLKTNQHVMLEIAMLLRNTVQARGTEAIDFLRGTMLPRLNCPPEVAEQLIERLRTQQAKDFRKTFAEFIKMLKGN